MSTVAIVVGAEREEIGDRGMSTIWTGMKRMGMEREGVSTRGVIASKMEVGGIGGGGNAKGKVSED